MKDPVSHRETSSMRGSNANRDTGLSGCHLLRCGSSLWKPKLVSREAESPCVYAHPDFNLSMHKARRLIKSAGGGAKKVGRVSTQIGTIQDRGVTDVNSRILRHVTDSVENI